MKTRSKLVLKPKDPSHYAESIYDSSNNSNDDNSQEKQQRQNKSKQKKTKKPAKEEKLVEYVQSDSLDKKKNEREKRMKSRVKVHKQQNDSPQDKSVASKNKLKKNTALNTDIRVDNDKGEDNQSSLCLKEVPIKIEIRPQPIELKRGQAYQVQRNNKRKYHNLQLCQKVIVQSILARSPYPYQYPYPSPSSNNEYYYDNAGPNRHLSGPYPPYEYLQSYPEKGVFLRKRIVELEEQQPEEFYDHYNAYRGRRYIGNRNAGDMINNRFLQREMRHVNEFQKQKMFGYNVIKSKYDSLPTMSNQRGAKILESKQPGRANADAYSDQIEVIEQDRAKSRNKNSSEEKKAEKSAHKKGRK